MIERPTTPGDWIQWDGPDGKWENYMGMIGEDSNRIPSINWFYGATSIWLKK